MPPGAKLKKHLNVSAKVNPLGVSNTTLKKIEPSDALFLREYWKKIAQETQFTLHHPDDIYQSEDELKQTLQLITADPHSLWLGILTPHEIAGLARFSTPYKNHPWYRHLGTFALGVIKTYWGCGMGSLLLQSLEDYAQKRGILRMEAYVRSDNLRALSLYEKFGYHIEGRRQNAAFIDGVFKDELTVAKFF